MISEKPMVKLEWIHATYRKSPSENLNNSTSQYCPHHLVISKNYTAAITQLNNNYVDNTTTNRNLWIAASIREKSRLWRMRLDSSDAPITQRSFSGHDFCTDMTYVRGRWEQVSPETHSCSEVSPFCMPLTACGELMEAEDKAAEESPKKTFLFLWGRLRA